MKDSKYLHNFPKFSPFTEMYKKLNFNPKIFKLAKLFSKNNLNYLSSEEKPKNHSIPRPKVKKEQNLLVDEGKSKVPHLPKLPTSEEHKIVYSYEFRNVKFSKRSKNPEKTEKNYLPARKTSEPVKSSVQTFNFSPLVEARTTSNSGLPSKFDESFQKSRETFPRLKDDEKIAENIRRKIIYSKRKHSVGVKDFSSFFDYQDGQIPLYSSFSNQ
jgi:hypothetical protein